MLFFSFISFAKYCMSFAFILFYTIYKLKTVKQQNFDMRCNCSSLVEKIWEKRNSEGRRRRWIKKKKPKATTSSRSTHRTRSIKGHLADEVQIHTALTANHSVALDRTKENFKLQREKCAFEKWDERQQRKKMFQEHRLQGWHFFLKSTNTATLQQKKKSCTYDFTVLFSF